ncbi:MAG: hypothetical protein ACE5Q6_11230 [Dehalococcoidia bacterium]
MSQWFHGFRAVITALGSIAALAATVVTILVALDVIGGAPKEENQSPIVGNITLDAAIAVAGQPLRAEVGVTDPDRDELAIQWTSGSGRFLEGDTGKSVIYEPPATGASFQLTAIISDGHNDPVRSSENFVLATPTPAPGQEPPTPRATFTPRPPQVAPASQDLAPGPVKVTAIPAPKPPTPVPQVPDIAGVWGYGDGFLTITPSFVADFEYVDTNSFGVEVGAGTANWVGDGFVLEGLEAFLDPFSGLPTGTVPYSGSVEVFGQNSLRVSLRYQNGASTNLSLTRVEAGGFN